MPTQRPLRRFASHGSAVDHADARQRIGRKLFTENTAVVQHALQRIPRTGASRAGARRRHEARSSTAGRRPTGTGGRSPFGRMRGSHDRSTPRGPIDRDHRGRGSVCRPARSTAQPPPTHTSTSWSASAVQDVDCIPRRHVMGNHGDERGTRHVRLDQRNLVADDQRRPELTRCRCRCAAVYVLPVAPTVVLRRVIRVAQ